MHFSKIITSGLLFTLSSVAIAAPNPDPLEGRIAELERRTEGLVARAGWTCAFGGNKACQAKYIDVEYDWVAGFNPGRKFEHQLYMGMKRCGESPPPDDIRIQFTKISQEQHSHELNVPYD
ncbi:uncharacterized protein ATNIH1004_003539 [Aspergillus tanneri]|uniref:Killer toxin Kp4 domain-containing protein n=1 Tax=Aspergillus tanneri TaxID=1220188 RepID=A0A5M9MZS4_9EURO|nr:uncharacterized protein ATNIH1004_003539 [Aspergillus tanneri]KAA8650850.1 hypothetical protein ATNIH1004_003539 [Aspergillus tanneri]